ncbi:MAG TPA: isochorismatase family protein, partial [Stellaceae bacterium]|nr:isochorismatase family protein [Stellaceae bacterium]
GAAFHPALDVRHAELVLRKGYHAVIDSYSAFQENDRQTATGLASYLRERGFDRVTLCGLATGFCVAYSALDAATAGFRVSVILEACRGIDRDGSIASALEEMRAAGVTLV